MTFAAPVSPRVASAKPAGDNCKVKPSRAATFKVNNKLIGARAMLTSPPLATPLNPASRTSTVNNASATLGGFAIKMASPLPCALMASQSSASPTNEKRIGAKPPRVRSVAIGACSRVRI